MATAQELPAAARAKLMADRFRATDLRKRLRLGESLIQGFLFFCGALSIVTTLAVCRRETLAPS